MGRWSAFCHNWNLHDTKDVHYIGQQVIFHYFGYTHASYK